MPKQFKAGDFSKYIYFYNQPNSAEKHIYTSYAIAKPIHINSLFAFEQFEAMHLVKKKYYKFIIRYSDKLSEQFFIKYQNNFYRIMKMINHEEQSKYLIIYSEFMEDL